MYTFKPFRFWCQKVLPLVYDDSLSYYELLCKLVKYLNDALGELERMGTDVTNLYELYAELKKYVDDYFESANFEQYVNDKLDEMAQDGTLGEIIASLVIPDSFTHGAIETNLVYSKTDQSMQGACYIGSGTVVYYEPTLDNYGYLHGANLVTGESLFSYYLKGYHGNTLTYNSNTGKIYITGAIDSTGNYINKIVVIDRNNMSAVESEFSLGSHESVYSLVYDNVKNEYYAITSIGYSTQSNTVYVYDSNFVFNRSYVLDKYVTAYSSSGQGVVYANDGYLYTALYYACSAILQYKDGVLVNSFNLPRYTNNMRRIWEVQSFFMDEDHRYYIGSELPTKLSGCKSTVSFIEVGIEKSVTKEFASPASNYYGYTSPLPSEIIVNTGRSSKQDGTNVVWCLDDAINIFNLTNTSGTIIIPAGQGEHITANRYAFYCNQEITIDNRSSYELEIGGCTFLGGRWSLNNCTATRTLEYEGNTFALNIIGSEVTIRNSLINCYYACANVTDNGVLRLHNSCTVSLISGYENFLAYVYGGKLEMTGDITVYYDKFPLPYLAMDSRYSGVQSFYKGTWGGTHSYQGKLTRGCTLGVYIASYSSQPVKCEVAFSTDNVASCNFIMGGDNGKIAFGTLTLNLVGNTVEFGDIHELDISSNTWTTNQLSGSIMLTLMGKI